MADLNSWQPYREHVQANVAEGRFASGRFTLLAVGPPFLSNIAAGSQIAAGGNTRSIVYPVGHVQNFGLGHNRAWARFFEIGSDRSVVISGHTVGQIGMGRVLYDGPSMLRAMYAMYKDNVGPVTFDNLFDNDFQSIMRPDGTVHNVRVPPGYENLFINLASDLFSQPIGLLVVFRNNDLQDIGAYYFERCVIPTHNIGFDATSGVIQEQVSMQFERAWPIRMANVQPLIKGTRVV